MRFGSFDEKYWTYPQKGFDASITYLHEKPIYRETKNLHFYRIVTYSTAAFKFFSRMCQNSMQFLLAIKRRWVTQGENTTRRSPKKLKNLRRNQPPSSRHDCFTTIRSSKNSIYLIICERAAATNESFRAGAAKYLYVPFQGDASLTKNYRRIFREWAVWLLTIDNSLLKQDRKYYIGLRQKRFIFFEKKIQKQNIYPKWNRINTSSVAQSIENNTFVYFHSCSQAGCNCKISTYRLGVKGGSWKYNRYVLRNPQCDAV